MGGKSALTSKISDWLKTQGYPLEMETAKEFISQGFDTQQSVYYVDTESGDSRETDVVASQCVAADKVLVRMSVVVECKKSGDKPYILFSTGHNPLPKATCVAQRASSRAGEKTLLALAKCPDIPKSPLFRIGDNSGYCTIQAFGNQNNDVAYKSLMSVSSAVRSMILASDPHPNRRSGINRHDAHILFPVVVIDNSLWQCTLRADGQDIDVTEIGFGTLVWKNRRFRSHYTLIHIVTRAHLKSFVGDALKTWNNVRAACEGPAKAAISAIPGSFVESRKSRVRHVNI